MKKSLKNLAAIIFPTSLFLTAYTPFVVAQIIPDRTLSLNSVVISNRNIFNITEGTPTGTNLFHSFEQFSVPTGQSAYFRNALTVENIITRVTGNFISNIDGLIRANGKANLFLINPNGIIFGANAQLNIGGSFIGSTANSIKFADGSSFSAINPQAPSLLAINVPIGLQMGLNPAAIVVQGSGNNLLFDPGRSEIIRDNIPVGLQVAPGQTLALVGGDIALDAGNLTAPGGQIELWSLSNGLVGISHNNGIAISNQQATPFGDIRLTAAASVDASGNGGGAIQVQGQRISVQDGAAILATTLGTGDGGGIKVGASESVEVLGFSKNLLFPSFIATGSQAGSSGKSGDIALETPSLRVGNGGTIATATFGSGNAGNMTVKANSVEAFGTLGNSSASGLFTAATDGFTGNAGDLTIETQRLRLTDGARVVTVTRGSGNGGNLTIRATEAVDVIGFGKFINPAVPTPFIVGSAIASSVSRPGLTGNAGNLTIDTRRLTVAGGGQIVTSTFGTGKGGNLTVKATEAVELIGTSGTTPPAISILSALAGSDSSGNAGNLNIETPQLTIRDGATATVSNLAQKGTAGDLQVNADSINLLGGGSLDAQTRAGEGGNIKINSQNILLRNNSRITTNAQQTATGGNITINTSTLLAAGNSDITANAQKGNGGRISITADGIFGTEFRDQPTPKSDITATSDLGPKFDGTVQIELKATDLNRGLVQLPETVVDSSSQISSGCAAVGRNSFTITGRGGLPTSLLEALNPSVGWIDWRKSDIRDSVQGQVEAASIQKPPVEATGWVINSDGTVQLVANSSASSPLPLNCSGNQANR